MKKKFLAVFMFIAVTCLAAQCAFAGGGDTKFSEEYENYIPARMTQCYVEGEKLGELLLNSRGVIDFIYLDDTLSNSITQSRGVPEWLSDNNMYYSANGGQGKAVFVVKLIAYKPWQVDLKQFSVGGYHFKNSDVLTSSMNSPFDKDARDADDWVFVLAVPNQYVKPGSVIQLGYGKYLSDWKVPR
jgi:hypothetical protein